MSANLMRVAVMRKDGISYHTDVTGWHAETVAIDLFAKAKAEARVLCVVWFEGPSESTLELRQSHWSC